MTGMSVAVDLTGVPETLLWTLYHRAEEARRPDAVLRDPLAVELVERIDYPFAERFGATAGRRCARCASTSR
jgi:O-methyltransferase involved in polyketide biosynthesis